MISIIVPVYNAEKYLTKCIESILSQSYTDFECILINDGSNDSSGQICDLLAKKDPRIIVIHQENKGVSAARNKGINSAKGDYITFVDSDDYCEPQLLEVLFNNIINYNVDFSICSINRETDGIKQPHLLAFESNKYNVAQAYKMLFSELGFEGFPVAKLYKTSILKTNTISFDENIKYLEDFSFNYKYLEFCKNIYFEKAFLYNYFQNPQSITKSKKFDRKKFTAIEALQSLYKKEKNIFLRFHLKSKLFITSLIFMDRYDFSDSINSKYIINRILKKNTIFFILDPWIHIGRKKSWIAIMHPKLYNLLKRK